MTRRVPYIVECILKFYFNIIKWFLIFAGIIIFGIFIPVTILAWLFYGLISFLAWGTPYLQIN